MKIFNRELLSWIKITHIPLRWALVVPFVLQTGGAVTVVGYLSYRSGQQATENLANQLLQQTSERVSDRLDYYLHTPQQIININRLAVQSGTLNLNNQEQLRQQLWQQMILNPSLPANGFRNEAGIGIGYKRIISEDVRKKAEKLSGKMIPLGTVLFVETQQNQQRYFWIDSQGKPGQLVYQHNFQTSPWYHLAKNLGKQGWLPISLAQILPILQTQAVAPVYDPAGKLQGFFTVAYVVSEISLFLINDHQFSPTGQIFIIEVGGELVATSFLTEASGLTLMNGKPARLSALNSQDQRTREITRQLIEQFGNLDQIKTPQQLRLKVAGQRLFVQITPYQNQEGLHWQVITVIPESDFMGEINENIYRTAGLCLLTLGAAIGSGVGIAHRCTIPIRRLNQASLQLAAGNLAQRLPTDSLIVEVKVLAESFNRMALQLQQSFDQLQNTLEESEEKFTTVFRTSPDAIAIASWTEGRFLEVNNRMIEFYGYSRVEMIGRTALELGLWVNLEERQQFRQLLETQGFTSNQEVRTRTQSGEIKIILLSAEVCNLQGEDTLILVIRDITERKQTQEALRQNEARFRQLAAASPGVIYTVVEYPSGPARYEYLSPAFEEIHEIPVADVLQDASLAFNQIHPDDLNGYQQAVKDCIETGKPFQYEWRIITPNGKIKWLRASSRFEHRETGEIAWHGVVIDITQRKQTEAQLSKMERWLQQYSRQSPSSIYTLVLEPDGWFWFEYMSSAVETIHEVPLVQALLNADVVLNQIHPDDQAGYEAALTRSAETLELFSHEWRIITSSGQVKWLRAKSQPERRRNGAIAWHGVVEDISDRKQLEFALQRSETNIKNILNSTVAAIASMRVFKDNTWKIDHVSAGCERMTGYTAEELVADNHLWVNRIEPEDWLPLVPQIFTNIFAEKTDSYEYRFYHKDGSVLWISQTNNSSWDETQQCWIVTAISVNITDRKQAEMALAAKTEELDRFFSTALDLLCIADIDGYFHRLNQQWEKALGYSLEELQGSRFLEYVHPDDLDSTLNAIKNLAEQKNILNFVNRYRCKNGTYRWIEWRSLPVGHLIYAAARDITDRKQAEMALKQSETRFLEISESSPANIYIIVRRVDGSWYFEHLSRAIEVIHEIPVEEVLNNANILLERIHPDDQAGYNAAVQRSLETLQPFQFEWRIITPSGKIKWLQGSSRPKLRENGDIAWYGVVIDITARKQVELALHQSEEKFKGAFDTITTGMALISLAGGFQEVNKTLCQMLGYSEEELLALRLEDIIDPLDHHLGLPLAEKMMRGEIQGFQIEKRFLHQDGHRIWGLFNIALVRDRDDRLLYLIAQITDISDRKQAELELQRQKDLRESIYNEATDALFIVDPNTLLIVDCNYRAVQLFEVDDKAELIGLEGHTLQRRPFTPDEFDEIVAQMQEKGFWSQEVEYITRKGKFFWGNLAAKPVQIANESINLVRVTDITNHKQAELELQRAKEAAEAANRAKSVFLANMSHELRTPLNVILGFTQLMNRSRTLSPDYQNYVKIMHSNGNYLLKLINEILELSKIEAGKLTVKNQAIDIFALLDLLQTTFSERVKSKKLEMNLDILPSVPQYIVTDAQKLQQVLINLIGNAIKFTEVGRITLRVSLENLRQDTSLLALRFEVEDTGVGIAPEDVNEIFEAFVQASNSQQADVGTGLGLSISRKLVELMGGDMTVSSQLGMGSIFGFTIPVERATATSLQPQQPKREVIGLAPHQPSYRILVVDDRLENRLLLVKLLEQVGLEVQQAASGEEAVLLWQQWHPHLIWMDLRMPRLDGYEATRLIRAEELKRQDGKPDQSTIIIALTAQASVSDGLHPAEGYRAQALTAGCNDYVSKPFKAETLFNKMKEHLGIQFTYAEDKPMLADVQTVAVEDHLTLEHLAVMPNDWVIKLYQVTRTCEQQAVQELIQQIPPEHSFLARSLTQLNQDFDFEKIMQLTQTYFDPQSY